MGLFGNFVYKNEEGENFWLHKDEEGDRTFYYFSKDPEGAIPSLPDGYMVKENPHSHMPYLQKGQGKSFIDKIFDILGI